MRFPLISPKALADEAFLNPLAIDFPLNLVSTSQREAKTKNQSYCDSITVSNDGFGGLLVYDKIILKLTGASQTPSKVLPGPIS